MVVGGRGGKFNIAVNPVSHTAQRRRSLYCCHTYWTLQHTVQEVGVRVGEQLQFSTPGTERLKGSRDLTVAA